jgi:alanine racemase
VVEILGPNMTADDLAEHARTNAYEVMTALGRRYARVYVDQPESEPENAPETLP